MIELQNLKKDPTHIQEVSLQQKKSLLKKRLLTLDKQKKKIKVNESSLSNKQTYVVDISTLDENARYVKKRALGWLAISIGMTLYAIFVTMIFAWGHLTLAQDIAAYLMRLVLGLIVAFVCWRRYFHSKIDATIYDDKIRREPALILYTNKPNKAQFDHFINQIDEQIEESNKHLSITSILNEELMHRDIDVNNLLLFLQKKINNKNFN